MFIIEIQTTPPDSGNRNPLHHFRCPLCNTRCPAPGAEKMENPRDVDVEARIHMMGSHNIGKGFLRTWYPGEDRPREEKV